MPVQQERGGTLERLGSLSPDDFNQTYEQFWGAAKQYSDITRQLVTDGELEPAHAARVNAAMIGTIFGANELHRESVGGAIPLVGGVVGSPMLQS